MFNILVKIYVFGVQCFTTYLFVRSQPALASKPPNWTKFAQNIFILILDQHYYVYCIATRNYFKTLEKQPLFWSTNTKVSFKYSSNYFDKICFENRPRRSLTIWYTTYFPIHTCSFHVVL